MTRDDRSKAFRDLHKAIAALTPHLADPGAIVRLVALAAAVNDLENVSPSAEKLPEDVPDQLLDLLRMAGPEVAPKLLQQLAKDLIQCRDAIAQTTDSDDDMVAWRNGSHVVISLAGSAGAVALQTLAERLNLAAHRQDRTEAMRLLPQVREGISALIQRIEATAPPAHVAAKSGGHR